MQACRNIENGGEEKRVDTAGFVNVTVQNARLMVNTVRGGRTTIPFEDRALFDLKRLVKYIKTFGY